MNNIPRYQLIHTPTALEKLENLSKDFKNINLFIKRDDCTGLAFGGNKGRKLEYLLADAHKKGAQVIITEGGVQSNHVRMTAAAALKLNMKAILVLGGEKPANYEANLLVNKFLGAELVFCAPKERKKTMEELATRSRAEGLTPYIIPTGGSTPLGSLGYIHCAQEIKEAQRELNLEFNYIIGAIGSGGTHAGLLLGKYIHGLKAKIMAVAADKQNFTPRVYELAQEAAKLINYDLSIQEGDLEEFQDYLGPGYGIVDRGTMEAVKRLAQQEGIVLGPVYTGKAMAGLLDLLGKGYFPAGSNVLFLHTGGSPEIFSDEHVLGFARENN